MKNLWSYINSLSLTTANRKWLADKLYESIANPKTDAQIKLDRLKGLIGVWDNEDGEKIADAISKNREMVYEREITPLD